MSGIVGSTGSKSGVIGETEIDYEEGEFTPIISSGVTSIGYHSNRYGYYTKIGNTVIFRMYVRLSSGTLASANLEFGGLPFVVSSKAGSAYWWYTAAVNNDGSDSPIDLFISDNGSPIIYVYKITGARFLGTDLDGTSGVEMGMSGHYYV